MNWNNFGQKSSFEHKKSLKLRKNGQFLEIFGFQNAKIGRKWAKNGRNVAERSGLSQILAKNVFMS